MQVNYSARMNNSDVDWNEGLASQRGQSLGSRLRRMTRMSTETKDSDVAEVEDSDVDVNK